MLLTLFVIIATLLCYAATKIYKKIKHESILDMVTTSNIFNWELFFLLLLSIWAVIWLFLIIK